jgi:glycosyltransferase involved in cell wall biosynthesis
VLCGPAPGPRFVVGAAGRQFAPATAAALGEALVQVYQTRHGALLALGERARARVEREFSVDAAATRLRALAGGALPAAIDTD